MNKMKKVTALVLSLAMILTAALPMTAVAADLPSWEVSDESGYTAAGDFDSLISGQLIFYPSDIRTTTNTYPLLVWANGTACAPGLYYNLLGSIAAQGFIVVTNTDMMSGDGTSQMASVTYALNLNEDSGSLLYGRIDTDKIGAFGHSQGGRSTVNATRNDSRIKAAVSIAGSSYTSELSNYNKPTLFLGGTLDTIVLAPLWVKPAYNKASGPAVYATLKGGVHTSCCLDPDQYTEEIVNWFDAFLNGNAAARDYFRAGGTMARSGDWSNYAVKNFN